MKNKVTLKEELNRMKVLSGIVINEERKNLLSRPQLTKDGWLKFYQDEEFLVMKKPNSEFVRLKTKYEKEHVEHYLYTVMDITKINSGQEYFKIYVIGPLISRLPDLKKSNLWPQYIKNIVEKDVLETFKGQELGTDSKSDYVDDFKAGRPAPEDINSAPKSA